MINTVYSVGPSSGANYMASMKFSDGIKTILTVFPDDYEKYIPLYKEKSIIE
jgi:cysteine synthase